MRRRAASECGSAPRTARRRLQAARVHAGLAEGVDQPQRVRGDDVQRRGAEVLHQRDLAAAVARAGGDRQRAEPLGAVVQAEPAGEQAVAHHVLEDVAGAQADHPERARDQVGPRRQVAPRVEDRGRAPGGPRGGVQPHQLVAADGEQAVGEVLVRAQVVLDREGQARQVGERGEALRVEPGGPEDPAVVRRAAGAGERRAQPRHLQALEAGAVQRLQLRGPEGPGAFCASHVGAGF